MSEPHAIKKTRKGKGGLIYIYISHQQLEIWFQIQTPKPLAYFFTSHLLSHPFAPHSRGCQYRFQLSQICSATHFVPHYHRLSLLVATAAASATNVAFHFKSYMAEKATTINAALDLLCMDDDDLRWGHPTCHVIYREPITVLAGDASMRSPSVTSPAWRWGSQTRRWEKAESGEKWRDVGRRWGSERWRGSPFLWLGTNVHLIALPIFLRTILATLDIHMGKYAIDSSTAPSLSWISYVPCKPTMLAWWNYG